VLSIVSLTTSFAASAANPCEIATVRAYSRSETPMIIWTASTHRVNWVTHPTPGWQYAFSDTGYTDSYLRLQWLKRIFDPETKERAGQKPRVLISDGFATHETLEIMEFCFENNIILCRILSHTSRAVFFLTLPISSNPMTSQCLARSRALTATKLNVWNEDALEQSARSISRTCTASQGTKHLPLGT
jgi:hypothetical protein